MVRSPDLPCTTTRAPSAISTGGRSMCGSACASAPPTVATLRTRMFDSVRSVLVMTGACLRTTSECSSTASGVVAPILSSPFAVAIEVSSLMPRRLTSFDGRNTPAFIISISAVPPAIGRMVGSSASSSPTASFSVFGSASSNGVMTRPRSARTRRRAARRTASPSPAPSIAAPAGRGCRACRSMWRRPHSRSWSRRQPRSAS